MVGLVNSGEPVAGVDGRSGQHPAFWVSRVSPPKMSLIIGLSAAAACQAAPPGDGRGARVEGSAAVQQNGDHAQPSLLFFTLRLSTQSRSVTYWIAPSGTTSGEDHRRPDPRISLSPRQPGKLLLSSAGRPQGNTQTAPAFHVAHSLATFFLSKHRVCRSSAVDEC